MSAMLQYSVSALQITHTCTFNLVLSRKYLCYVFFNVLLQRHAIEFVSTLITLGLFSPILFLTLLEFLPGIKKNPAKRTPKWTMYFDYTHLDLRNIRTRFFLSLIQLRFCYFSFFQLSPCVFRVL